MLSKKYLYVKSIDSFKISDMLYLEVKNLVELSEEEKEAKDLVKDLIKENLSSDFKSADNGLVSPVLSSAREAVFDQFPEIPNLREQNHIVLIALGEVAKELLTEYLEYNNMV